MDVSYFFHLAVNDALRVFEIYDREHSESDDEGLRSGWMRPGIIRMPHETPSVFFTPAEMCKVEERKPSMPHV